LSLLTKKDFFQKEAFLVGKIKKEAFLFLGKILMAR